ncbi:MAG: TatD family hydrolase [Candidatus Aenigmatarchaeota archaeon]
MIDVHCHLESKDYDKDREEIIEKCKKELKAIITCCAHPKDFDLTLNLVEKHKGFVFATIGIHPEYVKEISKEEKESFLEKIKSNKDKVVGIGETGLDFFWIKEKEWQERQKELFIELINFAKELNKPLIIHARNAYDEAVKILEQEDAKEVLMHMFGANYLVKRIIENNWYVSMNTIVLKSKKHKKVIRDTPLERILLETDSPWLGFGKRNDPLSVKIVAEKIAEIKEVSFEEVDRITTENTIKFFNLQV